MVLAAVLHLVTRPLREHHDTRGVGGCSRCYLLCLHRLPQCEPQLRCERLVEAHLCGAQSESVLLSEQVDTETVTGLCSDSRRRFKREVCGVFVSFDAV